MNWDVIGAIGEIVGATSGHSFQCVVYSAYLLWGNNGDSFARSRQLKPPGKRHDC